MASKFSELWSQTVAEPPVKSLPYLMAALMLAAFFYSTQGHQVPFLNPKGAFEISSSRAKREYVSRARELMSNWFRLHPDKPVGIISDVGSVTILPSQFANEIRSDERLSFAKFAYTAFHGSLPGFEGFREGTRDSQVLQKVLVKDLTKLLNKITEPLAAETAMAVPELLGGNPDWLEVPLRELMLQLIARLSSRVFLGEELCRNEEWLEITKAYTVYAFSAAEELRMWPEPIRFIVHWFLPRCQKCRELVAKARRLLDPVLQKRRQQKLRGEASFDDAIEWMEKEAKGTYYDPVTAQLVLSVAAIHTTTDLICQTLIRLAQHPEMLEPLRKEIATVLGEGGWKKTSLYSMKLLDAVIKESQRLKPIGSVSMRRVALTDVKLSDGTVVRKNTNVAVSSYSMWDPEVYENADEWDGYRFYKMRETPGKESVAQLVTTSPEHLGFGHGQHACPGRFFAANEVKIALIFLLMKYDWKLPKGEVPQVREFGFSLLTDSSLKMEVRRRQEEIVI